MYAIGTTTCINVTLEFKDKSVPKKGSNMNRSMAAEDPLRRELSVYDSHKQEWLRTDPNQFVVIAGDHVEGIHPDYESAFKAGIKAFGLQRQFLIKEICVTEPVYVVY